MACVIATIGGMCSIFGRAGHHGPRLPEDRDQSVRAAVFKPGCII